MLRDKQIKAVAAVIESGNLSSLHGEEVKKFEKAMAEKLECKYAIAVNSGTAALHVSLLALGLCEGNEVILPAMTFLATASAVLMAGCVPVFADVKKGTYNIDPKDIEHRITRKTRAIIPVHLAGIPAEMDEICLIADIHNLKVIEDACQALGAKYHSDPVGTIGNAGCFSFYPSKIITTGEGGMIVTNDKYVDVWARQLRNHGQVNKKNFPEFLGYNYRMTEIAGALGLVGLKRLDSRLYTFARRAEICNNLAKKNGWILPKIPKNCETAPTYIPLKQEGVRKHKKFYPPLYTTGLFKQDIWLPNTEDAYNRTLKVPLDF